MHITNTFVVIQAAEVCGCPVQRLLRRGPVTEQQLDFGAQQGQTCAHAHAIIVCNSIVPQQFLRVRGHGQGPLTIPLAQMPSQFHQTGESGVPMGQCQPAIKRGDGIVSYE